MSNESNSLKEPLWLIGFSLDADNSSPELYTLIFPGDVDEPLQADNYLIFFTKPELAKQALKLGSNDLQNYAHPSQDVDLVCEVARTLYLISQADIDPSATVINCLNVMFDLVRGTGIPMHPEYKQALYAFADHLTFNRELSTFFAEHQFSRQTILDAVLWSIGAVVSKSKLIK